jgi:hypothetical protein
MMNKTIRNRDFINTNGGILSSEMATCGVYHHGSGNLDVNFRIRNQQMGKTTLVVTIFVAIADKLI